MKTSVQKLFAEKKLAVVDNHGRVLNVGTIGGCRAYAEMTCPYCGLIWPCDVLEISEVNWECRCGAVARGYWEDCKESVLFDVLWPIVNELGDGDNVEEWDAIWAAAEGPLKRASKRVQVQVAEDSGQFKCSIKRWRGKDVIEVWSPKGCELW